MSRSFFGKIAQRIKTIARQLGKEEVLVLGDSHTLVFRHESMESLFPRHYFNVVMVGGATASGLENPNSVTGANKVFSRAIACSKAKKVILLLGEVDTGFVIWYRHKKYGSSIGEMKEIAVGAYMKLIHEAARKHRPIVISAPLPTIEDGNDWGEVANLRREVGATQLERTQLTVGFNNDVSRLCAAFHYDYVNLNDECMGKDGLVSNIMKSQEKCDHHYNNEIYAKLIHRHIESLL